jgi:hypothetical protein
VLYGHIPWFDALFFSVAFQIMITWLYHRTGRSVLIVMLFHLTSNIAGAVVAPLFTEPNRTQFQFLFTLFAWIIALVILRAGRLSSAGRTSPGD